MSRAEVVEIDSESFEFLGQQLEEIRRELEDRARELELLTAALLRARLASSASGNEDEDDLPF